MEEKEFYKLLELPEEIADCLLSYGENREEQLPRPIVRALFQRDQWEKGIADLSTWIGTDEDGLKILWEQLNIVRKYTYKEYLRRGIDMKIFAETMKFCNRFLREHKSQWGTYQYIWAWWFPRQMSLNEFRIGALEYEFVDAQEREIAIHIPSDADMTPASVKESLNCFQAFRKQVFPEWREIVISCDTWMLVPELEQFLGLSSNVVAFQKLFKIDKIDREATWFMDWIYPGYKKINEDLPETTTLQRKLKRFLLDGNAFGVAKGHMYLL